MPSPDRYDFTELYLKLNFFGLQKTKARTYSLLLLGKKKIDQDHRERKMAWIENLSEAVLVI